MSLENEMVHKVRQSGIITDEDVLAFRRTFFEDGYISAHEAEAVFEVNDALTHSSPEWEDFFVEALAVYIVEQTMPRGYVSEQNARWLLKRISEDGIVRSASELQLLVRIIEKASSVPEELIEFTLNQVRASVLEGAGPLAAYRASDTGVIDHHEVELIRSVLYALGGDGNVGISRHEAEFLFRLNEEIEGRDNDPGWQELFVKAVCASLMAAQGYQPASLQEAMRREAWLESENPGVWGLIGKMFSSMPGLSSLSGGESHWDKVAARQEKDAAVSQPITDEEARWLSQQIFADGKFSENEQEIVRFILSEAGELPQALAPLVNEMA